MKVLLCGDWDAGEQQAWLRALEQAAPEVAWLDREQALAQADQVVAAVVANPVPGSLRGLPGLRLIQSLWAGVDRLLADTSLPAEVPLARMVDPQMTAAMAQTALWAVLALHRGFFDYALAQRQGLWQPHAQRRAEDIQVLLLGRGEMGSAVTASLQAQGYAVRAWQRGERLDALLPGADIVVNLLPLTAQTRGLLDARCFAGMRAGASLVNLARGAHVVEDDLLQALDSGHLHRAVLDVFATEPLPPGHAFWQHPRVTVLPHAAAMTDERSAAQVVAHNLRQLATGEAAQLRHLVDRQRGY